MTRWCLTLASGLLAAESGAQASRESPLPVPTGVYSVGRTQFEWTDGSRSDPENKSGHREIVVWVWYPATRRPGAEPAEWAPGKWGEFFWSDFARGRADVSAQSNAHPISAIRTHAYPDSPVASAQQQYPIILFAPGLGTTPFEYASVIEDVVSHGYIVAGIVPTYFARVAILSDGRAIGGRDIQVATGNRGSARPTADKAVQAFVDGASVLSHDMIFALNQLGNVTASNPLRGRVDLTRVGAFGHSLGGAAALQVGIDEPRVRAVFALDPSPVWNTANPALAKPALVLSAASTNMGYDAVLHGANPGRHLLLAGTAHSFASDIRLMPFVPNQGAVAGQLDPARALGITSTYVEAFFDHYLSGKATTLLDGPSKDFPEITFETQRRSQGLADNSG